MTLQSRSRRQWSRILKHAGHAAFSCRRSRRTARRTPARPGATAANHGSRTELGSRASARQSDAIQDPAQSLEALSATRNCISAAATVRGINSAGKTPAPRFTIAMFAAANFPTARTTPDTPPGTFMASLTPIPHRGSLRPSRGRGNRIKLQSRPQHRKSSQLRTLRRPQTYSQPRPHPEPDVGPVAFCQKRRRLAGDPGRVRRRPDIPDMQVGQVPIPCAKTGAGLNPLPCPARHRSSVACKPRTAQVERCLQAPHGTGRALPASPERQASKRLGSQ